MPAILYLTLWLSAGLAEPAVGTLWGSGIPYHPREGDLVFTSTNAPGFRLMFALARSGHPHHVGIVARDRHGELCVYESGGEDNAGEYHYVIKANPIAARLPSFIQRQPHRRIWVRRRTMPLTPEQTLCLRQFLQAREGLRFTHWLRMGLVGLPFRPAPPTRLDQERWFCAELATQAILLCDLCPPFCLCPQKTTPRDLFRDELNLGWGWHPAETWSPTSAPPPPGPHGAP